MDDDTYSLVLAFDDESPSFANGFEAGIAWNRLNRGDATVVLHLARTEQRRLYERMASVLGYAITKEVPAPHWMTVTFTLRTAAPIKDNPHGLRAV